MISEVEDQLRNAGLLIEDGLVLGKLTHVRVEGSKRSKKPGWYAIYQMTLANGETAFAGAFGNLKTGLQAKIERNTRHWSEDDRREYKIRMDAARAAKAEADKAARDECARRAAKAWANLPESGSSPYLDRKRVRAFGLRFAKGSVVVPVRKASGDLVGLQWIAPDGEKKFMTATPKKGCFHLIGAYDPAQRVIAIAEGYATAATCHMATGWPSVVAFDAGNLMPVALEVRKLHPDARLVFCGDDDIEQLGWGCNDCGHFLPATQKGYVQFPSCPHCNSKFVGPTNPGRVKAIAAARRVNGVAAFPKFSEAA